MNYWIRTVASAGALALCLTTQAMATSFEDAQSAYNQGNYAEAVRIWRPLAARGDTRSEYMLGKAYDRGQGVAQNYAVAAQWYLRAAEQGLPEAQADLGTMYASGHGVPLDYALAIKWWDRAAG